MNSEPVISSPFDPLLFTITTHLHESALGASNGAEILSFLRQQLEMLRAAYVNLREAGDLVTGRIARSEPGNFRLPLEFSVLETYRPSRSVFLGYESLVNVLCQLDRALESHYSSTTHIPLFARIRFYRNKVAEHWEEYTAYISKHAMSFAEDKAPIPIVEGSVSMEGRRVLLIELKKAFQAIGITLNWPDAKNHIGVSIERDYSDAVFTALESHPKGLALPAGKDPQFDRIIKLLLEFAFPVPILEIEEYGAQLDAYLRGLLRTTPVTARHIW